MPDSPQRLTRAEQQSCTRAALLDAAEALFAEHGIGVTSIDEISAAAGFSRGAFYSNFADKDELVVELLEAWSAKTVNELNELYASSSGTDDFLRRSRIRETDTSRGALHLEFLLYALRNPAARDTFRTAMQAMRAQTAGLLEAIWADIGAPVPVDSEFAARILQALDDGVDMLRLIDPEAYPRGIYADTIVLLHRAVTALAHHPDLPPG